MSMIPSVVGSPVRDDILYATALVSGTPKKTPVVKPEVTPTYVADRRNDDEPIPGTSYARVSEDSRVVPREGKDSSSDEEGTLVDTDDNADDDDDDDGDASYLTADGDPIVEEEEKEEGKTASPSTKKKGRTKKEKKAKTPVPTSRELRSAKTNKNAADAEKETQGGHGRAKRRRIDYKRM